MKSLIIYHSETGNTKKVAEFLHNNLDSDIFELKPKKSYSKIGMFTSGIKRALMQQNEEIAITDIDVSAYDAIIIGTPVWAGHPTPVINAGLDIIKGAEGKNAVVFATFGKSDGETLSILITRLEDLGMHVRNTFGFTENETKDEKKIQEMIEKLRL
ncbi:MAG: NAD(P)H-dependent oxidoreductase [Methanomicrobiaceae archaeon]|nr:NAD(P)H-dependent oxidoreductase [Methanomicrobiaceae archaeon]